jgi:hypothetical protein
MSLWVFGDSFSIARNDVPNADQLDHPLWTDIVSGGLGFSEFYNYSQWGIGNDYIFSQILTYLEKFKPGDYVIIQTTSIDRQWFFKENPELSNYYVTHIGKTISKKQKQAIDMYINYLRDNEIVALQYVMFGYALQHITAIRPDCKILILPGFHHVPHIAGTLLSVCNGEFVSTEARLSWYDKNKIDPRPNHLSANNHRILGEKILETYKTGIPPDLTVGFDAGFLQ